ncbi:MAG: AbrB/MazE/SpoVT family DNA-binding domain-containing protein [Legionellales bacterium]|jgi:AbrB family looped-hinge helix DNA binding protein
MLTSTVTQKGQITIPAALREQLELQPGDKVAFYAHNNEIVLAKQQEDINSSFGLLSVNKKVTLADIEQAISQGPLDDYT